jgi:predicted transcriptional regulator
LVILQVLWRHHPATVRQIYEELRKTRASGYNSVLKLMQIMTTKGYVSRRAVAERPQVYHATVTEQEVRRARLKDLMDQVCGGSAGDLILQTLTLKRPTPDELMRVRDYLDKPAAPPHAPALPARA